MKNPHLLTQALLVLLIGLQAYAAFHPAFHPAVHPPSSALADAARRYRDNLGPAFARLASDVRSGHVLTKQDGVKGFAAGRKPLGDALDASFDASCDKDGTITDAAGLAADLDRAARALGGD